MPTVKALLKKHKGETFKELRFENHKNKMFTAKLLLNKTERQIWEKNLQCKSLLVVKRQILKLCTFYNKKIKQAIVPI